MPAITEISAFILGTVPLSAVALKRRARLAPTPDSVAVKFVRADDEEVSSGSARTERSTRGQSTSNLSAGTNALIRLGAVPVTCAGDILELFELEPAKPENGSLAPEALALLDRLRDGALTADELVRASGVEPAAASAALIELELGRKVALEDGVYRASI